FMMDIPTFNEGAVRESLLNAISHRDYRHAGSIFLRQFPRRLEVVSPGGFPEGITIENIIDRQLPRNRRIADSLARCGLVERAGQGANRIYESSIREGKGLPDFSQTDSWQVALTLHGLVRDPRFVRFLERIGQETQRSFDTHELLVLERIHEQQPVPPALRARLTPLVDAGILEAVGRGRGTRYLFSRRFHAALGDPGGYTRRRGLDRETNKALLLQHLTSQAREGCPMADLQQVLPGQSRAQIKRLMDELRRGGRVRLEGARRLARWYIAEE
ncbi:MAG: transcriptional regulator, partial [Calditrichaeota bacterium]|nr:transcriptional regulator [Calditrichota bacterium]